MYCQIGILLYMEIKIISWKRIKVFTFVSYSFCWTFTNHLVLDSFYERTFQRNWLCFGFWHQVDLLVDGSVLEKHTFSYGWLYTVWCMHACAHTRTHTHTSTSLPPNITAVKISDLMLYNPVWLHKDVCHFGSTWSQSGHTLGYFVTQWE